MMLLHLSFFSTVRRIKLSRDLGSHYETQRLGVVTRHPLILTLKLPQLACVAFAHWMNS